MPSAVALRLVSIGTQDEPVRTRTGSMPSSTVLEPSVLAKVCDTSVRSARISTGRPQSAAARCAAASSGASVAQAGAGAAAAGGGGAMKMETVRTRIAAMRTWIATLTRKKAGSIVGRTPGMMKPPLCERNWEHPKGRVRSMAMRLLRSIHSRSGRGHTRRRGPVWWLRPSDDRQE